MAKSSLFGADPFAHEPLICYAVMWDNRKQDWIVVCKKRGAHIYPVVGHYPTELEACFYANRMNRELSDDNS